MEERASIIKLLGLPEPFAVVLLIFSFILVLAPYFSGADFGLFKIPQFTDNARKKLKVIGPIIFLALVALFVPMISRNASTDSDNVNGKDTITILVANFRGPDPQNYLVTDKIIQGLRAATGMYPDISIQPLEETITEQSGSKGGSEYAREIGTKRKASIVLWGYYGATSEQADVSVYFEVLRAPKSLSLRRNLETQTLPIAGLQGFKIQTRLSREMSYLVLLTVGLARYESGDYEGAIDRFTKALTPSDAQPDAPSDAPEQIIDPATIYFYRGCAYYLKDKANGIDQAIADFNTAIKLEPDLVEAYNNRGIAYYDKGQYDQAISDYNTAIKLKPDDAEAYNNRGIAYYDKGQYDQAISDYNTAIKLKPDDAEAYNNRGNAYYDKGQHDQAISDYNTAIKLEPDDAEAYNNRGSAYDDKGQYDQAIADFDTAIKLKPDYAEAYNNRGNAYYDRGQHDQAIADYNTAIKLKPDYVNAYYNRGTSYGREGQYDLAISDFNTAIKLKPDYADAYYNRAIAYKNKGETGRAVDDLKRVLEISNVPETRQQAEQMLRELGVK